MEEDGSDCSTAEVEEIDPPSNVTIAVTRGRKAKIYEYFEEQDKGFMCKTCRYIFQIFQRRSLSGE